MKDYAKQPQPVSRTIDSNPKAANQVSIAEILQRYKKSVIQPAGLEGEDELLQGKFSGNPIQQASIEDEELLQPKSENKTGLPDNLKAGIENMSGYSMDDVKVHYNSDQPAQLNALAYAQGSDIHVGPGEEKHYRPQYVAQAKLIKALSQSSSGIPGSQTIQPMKIERGGIESDDIDTLEKLNEWLALNTDKKGDSKIKITNVQFNELLNDRDLVLTFDEPYGENGRGKFKSALERKLNKELSERKKINVQGKNILTTELSKTIAKMLGEDEILNSFRITLENKRRAVVRKDAFDSKTEKLPDISDDTIKKMLSTISDGKVPFLNLKTLYDEVIRQFIIDQKVPTSSDEAREPAASPYTFEEKNLNSLGLGKTGYYGQTMHHLTPYSELPDNQDKWRTDNLTLGPDRNERVYEPGDIYDHEAEYVKRNSERNFPATRESTSGIPISVESEKAHFRTICAQTLYAACHRYISQQNSDNFSNLINALLHASHRLPIEQPNFPKNEIELCIKGMRTPTPNIEELLKKVKTLVARLILWTEKRAPDLPQQGDEESPVPPSNRDLYIQHNQLQILPASPDGNCFFTAIGANRMALATQITPQVWAQMASHNEILYMYDYTGFIQFLSTNGAWNSYYGELLPFVAAYALNIGIRIYDELYNAEYMFNPQGAAPIRTVIYNGTNHYNGTQSVGDRSPVHS